MTVSLFLLLYNPDKLFEVFQPLVDYLNFQLPELKLKLIASKDYAAFEEKLYRGQFDFALPNPYQTLLCLDYGYTVFGKMGNDERFTGLFLVRKDSDIKTFSDIVGKRVSYPSETALAACIMPQDFLFQNGIDISNVYTGSQVSSILNVYSKNVDVGATWPIPWFDFKKKFTGESLF